MESGRLGDGVGFARRGSARRAAGVVDLAAVVGPDVAVATGSLSVILPLPAAPRRSGLADPLPPFARPRALITLRLPPGAICETGPGPWGSATKEPNPLTPHDPRGAPLPWCWPRLTSTPTTFP